MGSSPPSQQDEEHEDVGGPDLAAQAIRAGLVDEYHLFVTPILVGSGNQPLPNGVRLELELLGERLFGTAWFIAATAPGREARARASSQSAKKG